MRTIACQNKNNADRANSSSGAIFPLIARYIIRNGGVVYGAAFDESFNVVHTCVTAEEDLTKLYGSKYAFSEMKGIYKDCKNHLDNGQIVLFTGTPCQVMGLRSFIKEDYPKLYVTDCVCHGTPSNTLWQQYLKELSKGRIPTKVNFRNKDNGWVGYNIKIAFENGEEYTVEHNQDLYLKAFIDNIILRPVCYQCRFKGVENRQSDLTMGDLWGAHEIVPNLYDDKGTSLLLVHTQKGMKLLEAIKDSLKMQEIDLEKAITYNPSIVQSSKHSRFYTDFNHTYNQTGKLMYSLDKYIHPSRLTRGLSKIRRTITHKDY